jgi:hypothetical protein
MAQTAVFAPRHRGGLEDCRLWAVSRICPVVAIAVCPLSATSSRCVLVRAKQRLGSDAIHRHMRDAPTVPAAGVMGRAFWAIRVSRGCARSMLLCVVKGLRRCYRHPFPVQGGEGWHARPAKEDRGEQAASTAGSVTLRNGACQFWGGPATRSTST